MLSLLGFGSEGTWCCEVSGEVFPPPPGTQGGRSKNGIVSFLTVGWNLSLKSFGPGVFSVQFKSCIRCQAVGHFLCLSW